MREVTQLTIEELKGKRVLVAADLDVPLETGGGTDELSVADDYRLRGVAETTRFLLGQRAIVILAGHLGRPKGQVVQELRMMPVVTRLRELLGQVDIFRAKSVVGVEVSKKAAELKPGQVLILENVRFDPREENNDADFARELAKLADYYVNELFSTSHREHASIVSVPRLLPSYAGIRFAQEVRVLDKIRVQPGRPLVFIVGGSKKGKVSFVKDIAVLADEILLGGTLSYAQELEGVPKVRFPVDAVRIDDIGPESVAMFCRIIHRAGTVVWAGPLGRFEDERYIKGSEKIAHCITESGCNSVVGGGDTLAMLGRLGLRERFGFCSTGGGAMLEYLANGTLPGIEALEGGL
ncbi:phosphoglycerate kinase [Patescibacteria group bacterium]|nr:phosphoglycerate kinase [Patescibacteria group bacterium]